jgi:type II secretory pathway component PulF
MAMLVAANCDMPSSLRLSAAGAGSEKILLESEILAGQVEKGVNILEAGQFCAVIPKLFLYSVQLGTQRNELLDNLYSLSQMYAAQVRCWQGRLEAFLLPFMLVLLGGAIGAIIVAVFLPIVQVVTGLSG